MFARAILALSLLSCLALAQTTAQPPKSVRPIVLGDNITIASTVLNEDRVINVWLPDGYAKGTRTYPVLYLLDGGLDQDFLHVVGTAQLGSIWGRSQPVIVVGIASKDRRRELAGPTKDPELLKRWPTAGYSSDFRRHIATEVKPMIAGRFRTNGDDAVMGESMAGLFVVETWLRQPGLFRHYAAISPSLWWDKESLRQTALDQKPDRAPKPTLLIASENEGEALAAVVSRFLSTLVGMDNVCHAPQPHNHANIYHAITPMVLQFLFPPERTPDPQFGFEVPCSKKS
jgi:predicted alpha/beta superfamily hydrolase